MKIMKYVLLMFGLCCLNVSVWGQEKSVVLTMEDAVGMQEAQKEQEKRIRVPRNTFIVNFGYGWITSEVVMRSGSYKWKGGGEYKVAYNWVGDGGYGFGVECEAITTDFPEELVTLGYVAPVFVYCQKLGERWMVRGTASIGYTWNGAGNDRFSGVAVELNWGVEYMLNKVIGLGLGARWWRASISRPDGIYSGMIVINDRHGVNRLGIQGGLRCYF